MRSVGVCATSPATLHPRPSDLQREKSINREKKCAEGRGGRVEKRGNRRRREDDEKMKKVFFSK